MHSVIGGIVGKRTLAVLVGAVIALVLLLIWNDRIVAIMIEAIRANNQAQLLIMGSLNNVVVPFLCATPPAIAVLLTRGGVAGARLASLLALVVYFVPFILVTMQQGTSELLATKILSDAWANVSV